jgi:hypothetical protein
MGSPNLLQSFCYPPALAITSVSVSSDAYDYLSLPKALFVTFQSIHGHFIPANAPDTS